MKIVHQKLYFQLDALDTGLVISSDLFLQIQLQQSISAIKNIGIEDLLDYVEKYSYVSKWIFKDDEITNKDDIFITIKNEEFIIDCIKKIS